MISLGAFFAYLLFEWVSIPIYLRIIFVLLKRPTFSRHPFYRFLIIFGISNLLNYFVVLLFYVLPMCSPTASIFPKLPSGKWIAIAGFTVFYTAYQQDFLYVSISLNRLTAVWMPFRQQRLWKSWWIWLVLFAHLLPIPLTIHYLFCDGQFMQLQADDLEKGYLPVMVPTNASIYNLDVNLTTIYVNGFCLAICLMFNIATFIKIFQIKQLNMANSSTNVVGAMERNLAIISVVMTAMLSSSLIFQFIMLLMRDGMWFPQFLSSVFNDNDSFYHIYSQLPWINDLRVLSQPWLLMVVNEDIRNEIFPGMGDFLKRILKKKEWKTQVQIMGFRSNTVTY